MSPSGQDGLSSGHPSSAHGGGGSSSGRAQDSEEVLERVRFFAEACDWLQGSCLCGQPSSLWAGTLHQCVGLGIQASLQSSSYYQQQNVVFPMDLSGALDHNVLRCKNSMSFQRLVWLSASNCRLRQ